jgi:hypothetical protein
VAQRWVDYAAFHAASLETRDVDPVYPVLGDILDQLERPRDSADALWLSVCHVTWYDLGSALIAWGTLPSHAVDWTPDVPGWLRDCGTLTCATERRGNRDHKQLLSNLNSWTAHADAAGGLDAYLKAGLNGDPAGNWRATLSRIEAIHGNGRWASYKLAEILQKVNGLPLEPQDMGHANSSGPRKGLELLWSGLPQGNTAADVAELDGYSRTLCKALTSIGLEARVEEAETTLCDYHALFEGRHYVGHDIDQMLAQLGKAYGRESSLDELIDVAFEARKRTLPLPYLGEHHDWDGVDKDRRKVYAATGEIVLRA